MSSDKPSPKQLSPIASKFLAGLDKTSDANANLHCPLSKPQTERYARFYGLAYSALWERFVSGHIEDATSYHYDYYAKDFGDYYVMAFCAGSFKEIPHTEGQKRLLVDEDEWNKKRHSHVGAFFDELDEIVKDFELAGIVLEDREDFYAIKISNPRSLLKLIEYYLYKYDVLTLDDIHLGDDGATSAKGNVEDIKDLADLLRGSAADSWGIKSFSVAANEHISIRHLPPNPAPNVDIADIRLIRAEMTEDAAAFSFELLKNTYQDCLGFSVHQSNGLTLLQ